MTAHLKFAGSVLAVYGICYLIQKKGMKIPVIGDYLPGGQ